MNETKTVQALARGMEVLQHTRDVLWQLAEEDGDAERNAARWNRGGEGYTLLEQIAAVLSLLKALRDEWLSHSSAAQAAAQVLAFHREVVRALEDLLQVAESEEINTPREMQRHLRFVQRSERRGAALLARARQNIAELEAQ